MAAGLLRSFRETSNNSVAAAVARESTGDRLSTAPSSAFDRGASGTNFRGISATMALRSIKLVPAVVPATGSSSRFGPAVLEECGEFEL